MATPHRRNEGLRDCFYRSTGWDSTTAFSYSHCPFPDLSYETIPTHICFFQDTETVSINVVQLSASSHRPRRHATPHHLSTFLASINNGFDRLKR